MSFVSECLSFLRLVWNFELLPSEDKETRTWHARPFTSKV
jgi:hypothetical protein